MALIPYRAYVSMPRHPVANYTILGLISLISLLIIAGGDIPEDMILDGWAPAGLIGHLFVHADPVHLVGNMLFLWVFGNAVCAKFGNLLYPVLFLGFALVAAAMHVICDGAPAIGASGAVNGVVGAFVVLYPMNEIRCAYYFWYRYGTFDVSSIWIILLWLAFDIWGAAAGTGGVAYWAHLGGFFAGAVTTVILIIGRIIKMEDDEESLVEIFQGGK